MKKFAVYNYQFERITESDDEVMAKFPEWKYVNPDESFERRQELFGTLFPTEATRVLPYIFDSGKKQYIHKLVIPPTEDGVVVINLSNKKLGHRTNEKQEKENFDDYPFVKVIIDNRPGMQRILIEQKSTVFKEPKLVANILQRTFNKQLARHMLKVELYSQFPVKDFWDEVGKHPEGFRKIIFHFPKLNLKRLSDAVDQYFTDARKEWGSGIDLAFVAEKGEVLTVNQKNKNQKALAECMAVTGQPTSKDKTKSIEMITAGEARRHIWIGKNSYVIIPITEDVFTDLLMPQLGINSKNGATEKLILKLDKINETN